MMNNIYLTGEITKISKVKFDIKHKLQAVVIVDVVDIDNVENVFRVKLIDKMCEFAYSKLSIGEEIFICGFVLSSGLIVAKSITKY